MMGKANGMNNFKRMVAGPWVPPSFGKAPYLWSLALLFPLWKYVYVTPGALELAALVLTAVLFVPLYFASFWASTGPLVLAILATCLFGVLWAPHNFGASTFFVFGAGMCAGFVPARRAYLAVAAVMALALAVGLMLGMPSFKFMLPTLAIGSAIGVAATMDASLRRSRDQLLRKQEEVEHMATIAERERISRDLHDLLGHTLSLITLKAELAGKLAGRDIDACKQEIDDIEHCARNALAEVRAAVTGYRLSGFTHELAAARASLAAAGIELSTEVAPFSVPVAAENVMSLALREAVTNIIRHAGASRCEVSLAQDGSNIVFRIADNGVLKEGGPAIRPGNGLTGMRERVLGIGGQMALRAGQGLALELRLPIGGCA
jgi:two-component system sensor histidine kinase DesK